MKNLYLILLILLLPVTLFGATIYVDKDCTGNPETDYHPVNDTCSGGSDTVYSTIAGAEGAMSGGDIISIRTGSYNERPTIDQAGSDGTPTTFQSYNSEAVDVNGFSITANWVKIYDLTVDYDTTSGVAVTITGDDVTIDTCVLRDSRELILAGWNTSTDRLTITNSEFYDFGQAVKIGSGDNHIFKNNSFHDNAPGTGGWGNGDGIFLQSAYGASGTAITDILISGNVFYNWTQDGGSYHADAIQFVTQSSGPNNNCTSNQCTGAIVEYNYFDQREDSYGPGDQITAIMLDGDYHGIIIRYNIFKANKGINSGGDAISSAYIYNNTFIGDLSFSSSLNSGGLNADDSGHTGWYVHNNISVDNLDKSLYLLGSGHDTGNNYEYTTDSSNPSNTGVTVTVADPKFVTWADAQSVPGDYSLASDSPCINAGATISGTGNHDDGLNPNSQYADWPDPEVLTQGDYGAWEIGAYVYGTPVSEPSIKGLSIK